MSSESEQDSPRRSAVKSPLRKNNFSAGNNSFEVVQPKPNLQQHISSPQSFIRPQKSKNIVVEDSPSTLEQNKKLRKKLRQLSSRLDEQLQRAAENKLKMQSLQKNNHPVKQQTQNLQLQNAYKMIQRLQKSVKDFQNKQSYQVSVKRIMDLQSIIAKKEAQIVQYKDQIKTNKKILRQKQKHISQLLQNSKKSTNVTQDKQIIDKLKKKLKKLIEDNDLLRKKQLTKHQQLVKAQRKLVQIEQDQLEQPIGREEDLLTSLEEYKNKYKEAMKKVEKQNLYITRLNQRLDKQTAINTARKTQSEGNRKNVSKSLQQLPSLHKSKIKPNLSLLQHLPSPKAHAKLKRY